MTRFFASLGMATALIHSAALTAGEPPPAPAPSGEADPAEVARCVERLRDESFEARDGACRRLLDLGAQDPRRILELLPREDPDAQAADLLRSLRASIPWEGFRKEALREAGEDPVLRQASEDLSTGRSPEAIVRFWKIWSPRKPKAASRALAILLESEDALVRAGIATAFARLGDRSARGALGRLLADPDATVRFSAASALLELEGEAAAGEVEKLLADPDPGVRQIAGQGLAAHVKSLKNPQGILRLLSDPDKNVRLYVGWALVNAKEPALLPDLLKLLEDPEEQVRRCIAAALGEAGAKAAVPALVGRLADSEPSVRWTAAGALGKLGDPSAIPDLVRALADPGGQIGVQRETEAALIRLRAVPSAAGRMEALLADKDPQLRRTVASLLGRRGERSDSKALIPLLSDPELPVRWAAAAALGSLGDPDAIPALSKLLSDPDSAAEAARAMKALSRADWPEEPPSALVEAARAWWASKR